MSLDPNTLPRFSENKLIASITKESFYEFVKEFWDVIIEETPILNWHIEYLCNELQIIAERVFKGEPKQYDLIINVAPGSTKSTIVSQMFPAWCWTRMPSSRFICGSYAMDVAMKDSLKTRDIVQSEKYQKAFPTIQLREDENTKGLFTNTGKGFRLAVGVGGKVTGFHGHFLIPDDPINPEEAVSNVDLKRIQRWMRTTLPMRKVDKKISVTILIQQRLHQADPTGDWLERSKGQGVKHICLPAELTDDVKPPELRKFYVNGLFDPVRMPREILETSKKEMGAYGYASQMLQTPIPLGGGSFEVQKFEIREEAPRRLERVVRAWDKAGTQDGGNWSAGVKLGVDRHGFWWVLDVVRGQWSAHNREQIIRQTAQLDGKDVMIELEIEGGSGGKESGENTIRGLAGYKVNSHHPTGDKESRAYAFASQVGAGNVRVLKRDWTNDFIEEYRYFPNGRYDDQVDAGSDAFNRIAKKPKRIGGW